MLPIVQPAALRVNYTIRNRGRVAVPIAGVQTTLQSAAGDFLFQMHQEHGALAPGESYSASLLLQPSSLEGYRLRDDRMMVQVSVEVGGDTVQDNNVRSSALFHLAIPLPEISFSTVPTAVIGEPIAVEVIARNHGLHADLAAQTVTACLHDIWFRGCTPEYRTTTGGFAMPLVAAGTAVQFTTTMVIPPSAAWQDAAARYDIYLCFGQPATYDVDDSLACAFSQIRKITVRPEYESVCAPPRLVPGASVTLAAYNCGLRPNRTGFESETRAYRFHIVSLEAESNVTYALQRSDTTSVVRIYDAQGNSVFDRDAAPERIRVDVAQLLYLVMYSTHESLGITAIRGADGAS